MVSIAAYGPTADSYYVYTGVVHDTCTLMMCTCMVLISQHVRVKYQRRPYRRQRCRCVGCHKNT